MKNLKRRSLCILCTLSLLLSMVVVPAFAASSDSTTDLQMDFFDTISSKDILARFDYQSFSQPYGAGYGDTVVADAESAIGQAATFSYAGRSIDAGLAKHMIITDPNTLKLHTHSPGIWDAPIGELTVAQLQTNAQKGGYTIYKFDDVSIMPGAAESGNMLYLFECQGFRAHLDSYKSVLEGQTVDVYLSLKVTGDVTNTTDNTPAYFIDNLVITSADPEIIPEMDFFDTINAEDILAQFDYQSFSQPYGAGYGDTVVADTESAIGQAATFSYAGRSIDPGLAGHMIITDPNTLKLHTHSPGIWDAPIGELTVAQLQANAQKGGYTIYKFDDVSIMPGAAESGNMLYLFECQGLRAPLDSYKSVLEGQTVDVYLSLKVTGDVTNTTDNTPAYFIDRLVITNSDPYVVVHGDTCKYENYVYQPSEKIAPPSSVSELLEKVDNADILAQFDYQSFSQPYGAGYGDTVVADTESAIGQAATFSYAGRSIDAGLAKHMIITDPNTLKLHTHSPGIWDAPIGELTVAQLQTNAQNDGYTLYKFNNVSIMPGAAESGNMLYLFECQGFRAHLDSYKSVLEGQTVDVYLSLKVTGDVTNTTDNTPAYYIDSLMITTADAMENTTGTMVGTCIYGCGKTNVIPASTAHIQEFGASTFQFMSGLDDKVIADADSVMGTAVQYSAYLRRNENTNHLIMGSIPMAAYGPSGVEVFAELRGADLKVDQGYQLYKFSYDNFSISADASIMFLFNDWALQNPSLLAALKASNGKAIDIYLSMKITGNIYGENCSADSEENWPVYYIDRVIVVEKCSFSEYTSDNNATCEVDGTKSHSCSVCGLTEYAIDVRSAPGHSFTAELAEVQYCVTEATCQQAGVYYKSCTICGKAGTETFETAQLPHDFVEGVCGVCGEKEKTVRIVSASLTLNSILELNITVDTSAAPEADYKVRVTVGDDTNYQETTGEYKALIPAHRLGDQVKIELLSGENVVDTQIWTMDDYAESLRAKHNENTKMMNLLDALCQYGDYAAYYAAKDGSAAEVGGVDLDVLKQYMLKITTHSTIADLKPTVALYLDDACDIRVKFNAAVWGSNQLQVNSVVVDTEVEGEKVIASISGLKPQEWDDAYTITVVDAEGNTVFSVNYSVLSYVYGMVTRNTEVEPGLNNLLKAMYLYNQAANAYLVSE